MFVLLPRPISVSKGLTKCLGKKYTNQNKYFQYFFIWIIYYMIFTGAFYYYNTEANTTYQKTMMDVFYDSKEKNLPYRFEFWIIILKYMLQDIK